MAAGKRADVRAAEVDRLRRWCFVVLDTMVDMHGDLAVFGTARQSVERCKTIRDLRTAARDFLEWAKGLPPRERARIDRELRRVFAKGLDAEVANEDSGLERVVGRGRIVNEREYRLVQARIEEIYGNREHEEEVRNLDALLAGFRRS